MQENKRPYNIVKHEVVSVGRFTIIKDTLCIEGKEYPYSYDDSEDCVVVLPILGSHIVLINEYRHCLDDWFWEVPAGALGGEEPIEAARRELLEETGCEAKGLLYIGKYPNSLGTSSSYSHIFAAECEKRGTPNLEKTEFIKVEEVTESRFEEMIRKGDFLHMAGIVAWKMYKDRKYK